MSLERLESVPQNIIQLAKDCQYESLLDHLLKVTANKTDKTVKYQMDSEDTLGNLNVKIGNNTPLSVRIHYPWKEGLPVSSQNGLVVGIPLGEEDGRNSFLSVFGKVGDVSLDAFEKYGDPRGYGNNWQYILLKDNNEIDSLMKNIV